MGWTGGKNKKKTMSRSLSEVMGRETCQVSNGIVWVIKSFRLCEQHTLDLVLQRFLVDISDSNKQARFFSYMIYPAEMTMIQNIRKLLGLNPLTYKAAKKMILIKDIRLLLDAIYKSNFDKSFEEYLTSLRDYVDGKKK